MQSKKLFAITVVPEPHVEMKHLSALYARIESIDNKRISFTSYVVSTDLSAKSLYNNLHSLLGGSKALLLILPISSFNDKIQVDYHHHGNYSAEIMSWIRVRLFDNALDAAL